MTRSTEGTHTSSEIFSEPCRFGTMPLDVSTRARWTGPWKEETKMRYMLIMRSTPEAEKAMDNVDFNEIIAAMGRYNESLIKAGVLLAGEGLAGPEEGFVV